MKTPCLIGSRHAKKDVVMTISDEALDRQFATQLAADPHYLDRRLSPAELVATGVLPEGTTVAALAQARYRGTGIPFHQTLSTVSEPDPNRPGRQTKRLVRGKPTYCLRDVYRYYAEGTQLTA